MTACIPARSLDSNAIVHKALRGVKVQDPHQPSSFKGNQLVSIVFTTDNLPTRAQKLEEEGGAIIPSTVAAAYVMSPYLEPLVQSLHGRVKGTKILIPQHLIIN